jgi:hypothetical protein
MRCRSWWNGCHRPLNTTRLLLGLDLIFGSESSQLHRFPMNLLLRHKQDAIVGSDREMSIHLQQTWTAHNTGRDSDHIFKRSPHWDFHWIKLSSVIKIRHAGDFWILTAAPATSGTNGE